MAARRQQPNEVLLEQGEAVVGWLTAQSDPSTGPATGQWAALVHELARTLGTPTSQRPMTLERLASRYPAALGRGPEAGAPAEELISTWSSLNPVLSTGPLPATVLTPCGPAATGDVLGLHLVALVLTVDDLRAGAAAPEPVPLVGAAVARCTRTLAAVLAARHPGRSVEVRIPPYAAVQCGIGDPGPRHTRGTPPNVVEMDPLTFRSLAAGRLSWPAALASGRVHASGLRADLSTVVPLVGDAQD